MFYLASYGFINLAFYLESVASVDFRPTFKVNKYIGLVGFFVAFGMMFKLDFLAMIVALILMASLYFILKRRQSKLDYVDVWRSVWLSITRIALTKMESSNFVDQTWLPNIILFSGGTEQRPHLIELGKMLVGKQGILTNFDLIEHPSAKELFPKVQFEHPKPFAENGMFARRQAVNNIYAGIEMIAQTYGFSGAEPNTVMVGWANQTKNPTGFAKLLHTFNELDLNTIVVRYDKKSGFGANKTIDCWIFDQSSSSNFILILTKLLLISDKYSDAKPRVLFINDKNENQAEIIRSIDHLLDTIRLNATVKVVNNQLERKPYYTIVQEVSQKSDIVLMELPEVNDQSAGEFIEENNQLLEKIGTVIMLKASKTFSKIELVKKVSKTTHPSLKESLVKIPEDQICPAYPENTLLAGQIENAWKMMRDEVDVLWKTTLAPILHYREEKAKSILQIFLKTQQTLETKLPQLKAAQKAIFLHQLKSSVLLRLGNMLEEQRSLLEKEQLDYLQPLIQQLYVLGEKLAASMDDKLTISIDADDLKKNSSSGIGMKYFVLKKKLQLKFVSAKRPLAYHIKLKKLAKGIISSHIAHSIQAVLSAFSLAQLQLVFEYRKLIFSSNEAFLFLENHATEELSSDQIEGFRQSTASALEEIVRHSKAQTKSIQEIVYKEFCTILSELGRAASGLHPNSLNKTTHSKALRKQQQHLQTMPEKWQWQHNILLQTLHTEVQLMLIKARLTNLMKGSIEEINQELVQPLLTQLKQIDRYFSDILSPETNSLDASGTTLLKLFNYQEESVLEKTNRIFEKTLRNTKSIQKISNDKIKVFTEQSLNSITNNQFEYIESQELNVLLLLDSSVQSCLIEPFYANATNLVKVLFESASKVNDAIRLAALNLQSKRDIGENQSVEAVENIKTLIAEQQKVANLQRLVIEKDVASFNQTMIEKLKESQHALSVYGLMTSVEKGGQFKQKKIKRAFVGRIKKLQKKSSHFFDKVQAKFWHSQSDAKLMTERMAKYQPSNQHPLSEIIQLKEQLTPNRDILNRLPFYYQQLFAGKLNEQSSLWVGRELELSLARKAVQRYKSGYKGLVVVTGDYSSGKSFFVNHMIARFLTNRKVFSIKSVAGGSINMDMLLQAFRQATGLNGSMAEMLTTIPNQAVFIFDDLELWWERSPQGLQFIQQLVGILGEIANKVPVIVSCQKLTYNLIGQQTDIGSKTIQHIELFPMNSRDLQKAILFRHRTSGYGLQIDSTLPVSISINREARLFSRLFKQSGGNVGSALLMWMAAIVSVADKTIVVNTPKSVDLSPLQSIDSDLKQLLLQFLLHRQMDVPKLLRVNHSEVQAINDNLQLLLRAGLLKNISGNLYEIDPYMLHHFHTLIHDELLNHTENVLIR